MTSCSFWDSDSFCISNRLSQLSCIHRFPRGIEKARNITYTVRSPALFLMNASSLTESECDTNELIVPSSRCSRSGWTYRTAFSEEGVRVYCAEERTMRRTAGYAPVGPSVKGWYAAIGLQGRSVRAKGAHQDAKFWYELLRALLPTNTNLLLLAVPTIGPPLIAASHQ